MPAAVFDYKALTIGWRGTESNRRHNDLQCFDIMN